MLGWDCFNWPAQLMQCYPGVWLMFGMSWEDAWMRLRFPPEFEHLDTNGHRFLPWVMVNITWIGTSLIWLSLSGCFGQGRCDFSMKRVLRCLGIVNTMPASWLSHLTVRMCSIWREERINGLYWYSGWSWYCEDNIHIYAIEFEETLSNIVIDDFVHCLPYLVTSCFALYGQGSQLCQRIRMWDPVFSIERCCLASILTDIEFCRRRRTLALQLYATWCLWGFVVQRVSVKCDHEKLLSHGELL